MSAISPGLARRIDRLARRAHAFHRYAHHPLCGAYAHEVVSLGRGYVCRGCLYVAIGSVGGAIAGLATAPDLGIAQLLIWSAGGLAAASMAVRLPKALSRLTPSCLAGAALINALRLGGIAGLALVVMGLGAAGAIVAWYRRRGPSRAACVSCPERHGPRPCSGFKSIVQRERAFQRLAHRWLAGGTQ